MNIRARGVAIHNGKVLLVQHRGITDYWAFPGGGVEIYESTKETLEREMKEELNTNITIGRLFFIQELLSKTKGWHSVEFFYCMEVGDCDWESADFAHELSAVEWKDIDDENLVVLPKAVLEILREKNGAIAKGENVAYHVERV